MTSLPSKLAGKKRARGWALQLEYEAGCHWEFNLQFLSRLFAATHHWFSSVQLHGVLFKLRVQCNHVTFAALCAVPADR